MGGVLGTAQLLSTPARSSRKAKEFEPGDAISKANLKDLPLPAHIRVNLERRGSEQDPWSSGPAEQVVTAVNQDGRYSYLWVIPGDLIGYADPATPSLPQELIYGAIFLGPWTGSEEYGRPDEYDFEIKLP